MYLEYLEFFKKPNYIIFFIACIIIMFIHFFTFIIFYIEIIHVIMSQNLYLYFYIDIFITLRKTFKEKYLKLIIKNNIII